MKKLLCIMSLIAACFVCSTCSFDSGSGSESYSFDKRLSGTKYFVQSHNLGGGFDISCLVLQNGWETGKIQAWYDIDSYTQIGSITLSGHNATIDGLDNNAAPLNGSWNYEYDDEYNVHILRRGTSYVIFW